MSFKQENPLHCIVVGNLEVETGLLLSVFKRRARHRHNGVFYIIVMEHVHDGQRDEPIKNRTI